MFFFGVLRCSLHLLFQIFRALFIEIRNGIGLILCLCVIVRLAEAECALDPCIPRLVGLFFFCGVIAGRYIVQIELPEALNKIWYTRQYYGTVAHNAKAVYQKFMGWYDSNPVNLNPLMPSDSAKKWVEYLGDVDKVLQMAKADFDKGEYQWVAEVTNTIVFADPTNTDARLLCADALEQLGYQAESGPWRNEYLTAAQELRHGNANFTASTKSTGDMVKALSAPMLFDYMAIVMDKQALADRDFTMNVILPDVGEQHMLRVKNGVLLVYADTLSDDADVSITCPKNALFAILTNNQETVAKAVKVEGSAELLTLMMENMNQFPITGTNPFNIIEP